MDQAADIMRLGMFSARALPVVSLCHNDPSRRDPALCGERCGTYETLSSGNYYGIDFSVTDCSDNIVLDTESRLVHGCVFES